jgi:hypothetical protein
MALLKHSSRAIFVMFSADPNFLDDRLHKNSKPNVDRIITSTPSTRWKPRMKKSLYAACQSARSVYALAAIIALVIASTAAPNRAEEPGGILRGTPVTPGTIPGGLTPAIGVPVAPTLEFRNISVTNYGFYIAAYKVSYTIKSTPQVLDSGKIGRGKNFSFSIPSTASNIQIDGGIYTNFTQPEPVFRKRLDRLDTNLCLTLVGGDIIPQIKTCN